MPPNTFAESASVRTSARVFATKFTVGDNIRVLLETETPRDYTVEPPSEKTDLSPFELKKIEVSPVVRGQNRARRTFILIVTAFEKGVLTFPPVAVRYRTPGGQTGEMKTEPLEIEVASVGRRPSDKDDIRAIKGPESFGRRWFWTTLEALLIAVLSLILAVRVVRRRLRRGPEDESTKPPHVRARLEMERLKEKLLPAVGKPREHAAEAADVLRRYVERRFGVEAMEKTTAELSESMKIKGLDRTMIDKIRAFLERADQIKFANEEPGREELNAADRSVLAIVDDTTPKETESQTR